MHNDKCKHNLRRWEIVSLIILTPIIFLVATMLLLRPVNSYAPYWFSTPLGFFIVLGFSIIWIIVMRLWPLKNIRVKILLTLLVLTLSGSVLACWVILNALSDVMH